MSSQGFFGRVRALINRAVYWLTHRPEGTTFRGYVRQLDPSLQESELRTIRRQAETGRAVASAATAMMRTEAGFDPTTGAPLPRGAAPPGQTQRLREALGGTLPPREPGGRLATTVEVHLFYEVETYSGTRRASSVVLGATGDPNGPVSWETTLEELRARAQEIEASREGPSDPGTIDWSTVQFIPPLRFPPNP